jgi:ABC-type transport system involved in multi-copper enzyme maturation permease subunit
MIKNILAVTLISFREGLRHRVLYVALILALLVIFFSVLVSGFFMRDISKVIVDLCLAAVSVSGLLVPFFLAVDLLAKDIERRTILTILARAVSRSEYILGKFGGLILLTGVIMSVLACASLVAIWGGMKLYGQVYFATFSWSAVLISIGVGFLGMIVLNAVVIMWCSITTSSFLATILTLLTYIIGQTVEDVVRFISIKTPGVEIAPIFQKASNLALYVFPNLAAFDFKLEAAHGISMPQEYTIFLVIYALGYSTVALSLAILVFRRRDLT